MLHMTHIDRAKAKDDLGWKKCYDQTYIRSSSFIIMEPQLRATLKPLQTSQHNGIDGFNGGPQLGPHYALRRQSFGQPM